MPRYGYIRDKLDVKVLVLYLTSRTAAPIDFPTLTDLSMCDEGVDYFMFSEAVSDLIESGHLLLAEQRYSITEKGRKICSICENDLPASIRQKCDRNLAVLNARLRQEAQIRTEINPRANNDGFTIRLILDDNDGNLMTVELYSPTEEQATKLATAFRNCPERIYRSLVSALNEASEMKD